MTSPLDGASPEFIAAFMRGFNLNRSETAMRLTSNIQQRPISDNSKTILETDEGDTLALFTDRSDYVPVGSTKIRFNGDQGREMSVPIESLRDIAEAITEHANHLDQFRGKPSPTLNEPF